MFELQVVNNTSRRYIACTIQYILKIFLLSSYFFIFYRYSTEAMSTFVCYLIPDDSSTPKIKLTHNQDINIADGGDRFIFDTDLSEPQLIVNADTEKRILTVKLLNDKSFCCNGFRLLKGVSYKLNEGFRIHLQPRKKIYKISFSSVIEKIKVDNENQSQWELIDNKELLVYTPTNIIHSAYIAAFDMDGTLIKPKSGLRFPKDDDDWELLFSNIKNKFKEKQDQNYKIVIFTNQSRIEKSDFKRLGFQRKIENIVKRIGIPIQVFIATGQSIYRKPVPGMWYVLTQEKNGGIEVDMEKSFFVGDAAGRGKNWAVKKPKDHSLADRLFAANAGLKFYTPEEFFLGAKSIPYNPPRFDPKTIATTDFIVPISGQKEVILMVGCPGSGKSFFSENFLVSKGYVRVNRDKLGSWQKCIKVMEEALSAGKKVVIDNTNPNIESRKKYIESAKKFNVQCRCFVMKIETAHAKHNNKFRELTDKSHLKISDIIINSYFKQFEEPTLEEGFTEIVEVPFLPKFNNDKQQQLYNMFLLDSV